MTAAMPLWIDIAVAALLVASGLLALTGAIGLVRLRDFMQRMHPPALAYTLGAWCVTLASILYFSALETRPVIHAWIIIIMLSISMPITTILLARAALFRRRQAGDDVPPPLRRDGNGRSGTS